MIVFNTDLDNTLIYSYKHDIGSDKRNVELYQGREISFITEDTYRHLNELKENVLIVPVTTRTVGQYGRISLGIGSIKYALVCNGGILLEDGISNEEWLRQSRGLIADSDEEMSKALTFLSENEKRYFELRYISSLFAFTKCSSPETVVMELKDKLDGRLVEVFNNGDKVYAVPRALNKGTAIKRFKEYVGADMVIAAGDAEFDVPMVETADYGIVPAGYREKYKVSNVIETEGKKVFSEEMLMKVKEITGGE